MLRLILTVPSGDGKVGYVDCGAGSIWKFAVEDSTCFARLLGLVGLTGLKIVRMMKRAVGDEPPDGDGIPPVP